MIQVIKFAECTILIKENKIVFCINLKKKKSERESREKIAYDIWKGLYSERNCRRQMLTELGPEISNNRFLSCPEYFNSCTSSC